MKNTKGFMYKNAFLQKLYVCKTRNSVIPNIEFLDTQNIANAQICDI